jgi:hypothetical protein
LFVACGGGGSNPPSNPLSVTTTSLSQGQVSVAYTGTLSATGGTAPYSWTVKSGSLPAGLSLSTAGAITGTPTAAGASTFVAQVTDSKSGSAASGNLSIAISGGMLTITTTTAPTGTVGTAYPSFQLAATGGVPPYTWAVASGSSLPAGLSLSTAGVVSGTPTASGAFSPSIAVTDETTTNTTSQNVNFTIVPAGTPLPDGNYAFQFNGTLANSEGDGLVAINGAFEVAKGTIGVGFYSENILGQQPETNQLIAPNSTVSIGSNGLGQIVLNLQGGGTITLAIAVPASALTPGNDSDIRIIGFNSPIGTSMPGTSGSGVLKAASFTTAPAFKGGYAFGFRGFDIHTQPEVIVGSFQADGNGNITSGSVDINDNGTLTSETTVTGGYTTNPGNISGTIQLKFGGNTLNYGYYQVSPTELLATSADMIATSIPLVSGAVLQQTGPFSNASFTGANVLEMTGHTPAPQIGYLPVFTLGLFSSTGKGNVTASYDEIGPVPSGTYTATYTVDATTARTPITSGSTARAILYLVSSAKAFVLSPGVPIISGIVEAQTGSPFSNASLKGNYLGGSISWLNAAGAPFDAVSLAAADGAGNVQFTSNTSYFTTLQSNVITNGTYAVDNTGRAPVTVAGDTTLRIFYVVSPTKAVLLLSGENGAYLASFEQ